MPRVFLSLQESKYTVKFSICMAKSCSLFHNLRQITSVLLITVTFALVSCAGRPNYQPKANLSYANFEVYFQEKLNESKRKNHRPGNEERYISFGKKTPLAFLYIHGFGASRAEGEDVMEKLAKKYKANTYLLRLPGHGTNKEDQRDQNFNNYLDASREALYMMQSQGDKVIVFGSSMGGLLATWLASEYPEEVDGLVLANPFYAPVDGSLNILNYPGGLSFIHLLKGKVRASVHNNPKVLPERNNYWYPEQYFAALVGVNDLKNYAAVPDVFRKVTSPALLLYYYKNEKEQDPTASVPKMLEGYANFGLEKTPNPLNKKVAVENGMHVLMSKWVITDKVFIEAQIDVWLKELMKTK
ncbi:alpha/beta hydrolase [Leptospira levettii]|uniref:alpha/beta hydrolase n=1 Tax=Leptospira levettii TaxID=2023178 RepID=UPI00108430EC|nr:alpha/beta hydrolase [Leptospira levettii]